MTCDVPDEAGAEPGRADGPTHEVYLLRWYTWRAIRRDGRLTDAELAAQWQAIEAAVRFS